MYITVHEIAIMKITSFILQSSSIMNWTVVVLLTRSCKRGQGLDEKIDGIDGGERTNKGVRDRYMVDQFISELLLCIVRWEHIDFEWHCNRRMEVHNE